MYRCVNVTIGGATGQVLPPCGEAGNLARQAGVGLDLPLAPPDIDFVLLSVCLVSKLTIIPPTTAFESLFLLRSLYPGRH